MKIVCFYVQKHPVYVKNVIQLQISSDMNDFKKGDTESKVKTIKTSISSTFLVNPLKADI